MRNKLFQIITLCICVIVVMASAVPTVYASSAKAIGVTAGKCSSDPNAPCYVVLSKQVTQMALSGDTLTCGVNIQNALHQNVAQLWTNVHVVWKDQYTFTVTSLSYGTWVRDWRYGWQNIVGPSGSTGDFGYYIQHPNFRTYGTVTYLGMSWGIYSATVVVNGDHQWSCQGY